LSVAFIGVGAFDVSDFHADIQPGTAGFSPNVGLNLSERFSIDGSVVVDRVETERVVTYEVSLVINRARRRPSRWKSFLRLGGGGHYESEHVTESQHQNQDRSITARPAYDHKKLTGPNFFLVTAGSRYLIGRHVAFRADAGGVIGSPGFGIQGAVGMVIPLGSFVLP
jgi:hypothetical protein